MNLTILLTRELIQQGFTLEEVDEDFLVLRRYSQDVATFYARSALQALIIDTAQGIANTPQ